MVNIRRVAIKDPYCISTYISYILRIKFSIGPMLNRYGKSDGTLRDGFFISTGKSDGWQNAFASPERRKTGRQRSFSVFAVFAFIFQCFRKENVINTKPPFKK